MFHKCVLRPPGFTPSLLKKAIKGNTFWCASNNFKVTLSHCQSLEARSACRSPTVSLLSCLQSSSRSGDGIKIHPLCSLGLWDVMMKIQKRKVLLFAVVLRGVSRKPHIKVKLEIGLKQYLRGKWLLLQLIHLTPHQGVLRPQNLIWWNELY